MKTVLIVEDDHELRRLFGQVLALEGFEVKEARGGLEAVRMVDSDRPDIVILDLVMPGIDGFAVRKELAAQVHTRRIPIVVVTGLTDSLQSLDVPCILRKPITSDEVVAAVRQCLVGKDR